MESKIKYLVEPLGYLRIVTIHIRQCGTSKCHPYRPCIIILTTKQNPYLCRLSSILDMQYKVCMRCIIALCMNSYFDCLVSGLCGNVALKSVPFGQICIFLPPEVYEM